MKIFRERVVQFIKSIPKGKVVSYGQVAAAAGSPRAARQVGGVLRSSPDEEKLPWWRVLNNEGYISIRGNWTATKELQKKLLEREGVVVSKGLMVDMKKYRWAEAVGNK